jgi:hypothetical protein
MTSGREAKKLGAGTVRGAVAVTEGVELEPAAAGLVNGAGAGAAKSAREEDGVGAGRGEVAAQTLPEPLKECLPPWQSAWQRG